MTSEYKISQLQSQEWPLIFGDWLVRLYVSLPHPITSHSPLMGNLWFFIASNCIQLSSGLRFPQVWPSEWPYVWSFWASRSSDIPPCGIFLLLSPTLWKHWSPRISSVYPGVSWREGKKWKRQWGRGQEDSGTRSLTGLQPPYHVCSLNCTILSKCLSFLWGSEYLYAIKICMLKF